MKKKALLLYSTIDGQTFAIISKVVLRMTEEAEDIEHEVYDLWKMPELNLDDYSTIMMGAAIRYNKFDKPFLDFIKKNYQTLNDKKSAFFCVNLTARKPGKDTPETNGYARRFLAKTPWKPDLKGVFAGSLRYPRYTWYDKILIKFIMWMDGEKQDLSKEYNYTNWQKVDEFAQQFIELTRK